MGCLFCNILSGKTPSTKVYENDKVYAFEDINPQSPVHVLVIPKTHVEKIEDLTSGNSAIMADLFLAIKEVARVKKIDQKGYGGQIIWHIHVHVMGGKDTMGQMIVP
jgi:histidine triad (HIT) family protein